MPPITPEYLAAIAALTVGTAFAVFMASRRAPELQNPLEEDDLDNPSEFAQEVLPLFEERNADLVKRLREVAQKLGRERAGGITSADVIAALERDDPIMHKRLQAAERRIMGSVFVTGWMQTGEWRPTGSRGRPQRVWVLKEHAEGAAA